MGNRSEVFENYTEIARERGLIAKAEVYDPRIGSDDLSTIEVLYGVKPNGKDEKEMMDQAHPDSVIIAPAYDRVNGLVENNKERHNIMVGIITKAPQAKLTQHRYASASNELSQELLRLGFQMDNKDENELRILADSCAERMQKQAWIPLAIGIGAIAAGLGLIYELQNHGYVAQGVHNDCQKVIDALNKLMAGAPDTEQRVKEFLEAVLYIQELNDSLDKARSGLPSMNSIGHPGTTVIAADISTSSKGNDMKKLLQEYKAVVPAFIQEASQFMDYLRNITPKEDVSSDLWAGIKKLWHKFSPGDIGEVFRTLIGKTSPPEAGEIFDDGLLGELKNSIQEMQDSQKAIQDYVQNNHTSLTSHLKEMAAKVDTNTILPDTKPAIYKKKPI